MLRRWVWTGLLASACAAPASAQVHAGLGVADEIDGEMAGALTLSWLGADRHPWELVAGYVQARDRPQGRLPDALFVAAGRRLVWRGWLVSGGIAWVGEDNDVLSGHAQFLTGAGYDFGRVTVIVRHLSNGGFNGRNRGETMVVAEVAF